MTDVPAPIRLPEGAIAAVGNCARPVPAGGNRIDRPAGPPHTREYAASLPGKAAPPGRGARLLAAVLLRPARRPWWRHGGGLASLAAFVPGLFPVTRLNDPIGACHEVAVPEALENGVALFQVVSSQESPCVQLFVGLGPPSQSHTDPPVP